MTPHKARPYRSRLFAAEYPGMCAKCQRGIKPGVGKIYFYLNQTYHEQCDAGEKTGFLKATGGQ